MGTSSRPQDYHKYRWGKGERVRCILFCTGLTGMLAYFFYRSVLAVIPLSVVGFFVYREIGRNKARRAREELTDQFRECILAVAASLQAGYSVENAFLGCDQDMALMYGEEASICKELNYIRKGLKINIPLEELLGDMAARSDIEDIAQFARIFALAKRNGGNMTEIIKSTACRVGKKIELRQEIQTLLGGKKMELVIMEGMPFGILCYVNMGNPGYFDSLYHNLAGVGIMTACLAVYLGACLMGRRIMDGLV